MAFHFFHFVTFAGARALVTRRMQGNKWLSGEGDIQGNKPRRRRAGGAELGRRVKAGAGWRISQLKAQMGCCRTAIVCAAGKERILEPSRL